MSKRALDLKKRLAAGEFTAGAWVTLSSPTAFEVIADGGFDWVIVDDEHSTFNPETLLHMLMAFKATETVPLIRLPWNDAIMVKKALDMGFDGVMLPGIGTVADVRAAVSACRYPPAGRRGFGPIRVSAYGKDTEEYARLANASVFCIIQIENISAGKQIGEIVKIPGIDGILVGPNDMSGTADCFLDTENPKVVETIRKVYEGARSAEIPYGGAGGNLGTLPRDLSDGCQFLFLGGDIGFLQEGMANAIKAFRSFRADLKTH